MCTPIEKIADRVHSKENRVLPFYRKPRYTRNCSVWNVISRPHTLPVKSKSENSPLTVNRICYYFYHYYSYFEWDKVELDFRECDFRDKSFEFFDWKLEENSQRTFRNSQIRFRKKKKILNIFFFLNIWNIAFDQLKNARIIVKRDNRVDLSYFGSKRSRCQNTRRRGAIWWCSAVQSAIRRSWRKVSGNSRYARYSHLFWVLFFLDAIPFGQRLSHQRCTCRIVRPPQRDIYPSFDLESAVVIVNCVVTTSSAAQGVNASQATAID